MLPILTPDQMRTAEAASVKAGASEPDLMARAGAQIAEWIDSRVITWGQSDQVAAALVGPGNNGGDALVALAGLVQRGWQCSALLVQRKELGDLPADKELLDRITIIDDAAALHGAHVIIDGIFGIGGRSDLDKLAVEAINAASHARHTHRVPLVAIDCPTGVDATTGVAHDDAFPADVTLCIQFPKAGLLREPAATFAGELEILDIGIEAPDDFTGPYMATATATSERLPHRGAYAHKSQTGGLLVVGGSPGYFGAPRLTAEAALRSGPGYVGLAAPRSVIATVAGEVPEIIYHPTSDSDGRQSANTIVEALDGESSRYTALVIGPGIGRDRVADALMSALFNQPDQPADRAESSDVAFGIPRRALSQASSDDGERAIETLPVVLDADALNWLAKQDDWPSLLNGVTAVLTPHPGEMARLLQKEIDEVTTDPFGTALDAAKTWNQIVVFKVGYTAVAHPDGTLWVSPRAPSELATAGTGDALSGIIGGLLAQGLSPGDAAACAVYLGAQAGRLARDELGALSVVARDVIRYLPFAISELQQPQWER
jgi:ADP-dependent NAD(P)H-hydrate dehydratase / NAD(P)H-hydrate epimerase